MITAVICAYWWERAKNIDLIVESLCKGKKKPSRIIIWNNNENLKIHKDRYNGMVVKVDVITSSKNWGHRARFIAAMLDPTDYYFFIDDDMMANKETLSNYINWAEITEKDFGDFCLTHLGRSLSNQGEYNNGGYMVRSSQVETLQKVGLVIGVGGIFCTFGALVSMVKLDNQLKDKSEFESGREADIILGMANPSFVVPTTKQSELIEIGQKGVGMFKEEGHQDKRNKITKLIHDIR